MNVKSLVKALRPKQWTKNLIVFVGAIFSHNAFNFEAMLIATEALVAFCLLSSAGYLINDLRDAEADRLHPAKRFRPIASGAIKPPVAWLFAVGLASSALALAFSIRLQFAIVALAYLCLTLVYSAGLKDIVLVDLFAIAGGFVLRAAGGAVAIGVRVSPWLYVCTVLAALFIGLAKRRHELVSLADGAQSHRKNLREYTVDLLDQLIVIVVAGAIMAYSLYTFSAQNLPRNDSMMLTIPLVIYGLFRYLFLVRVKHTGGSPEDVLLTDRPLLATLVAWVALSTLLLYIG
ncbi:MAG: decaprenyl-phosphate phosphoribosyltransferase [Chloroflexi bacterium]|nr:decaprenyl-phosphate phosphoribosyltransferase [Chloroflexota bacterium]